MRTILRSGRMAACLLVGAVAPLLCVLLGSCSSTEREARSPYPPGHFEKQIAALTQADVAADVAAAIAGGDRRFLLNVGFGGSIPGVTNWSPAMQEKYGTRILDGTGDLVFGQSHQEYKRAANDYAQKYNRRLIEQISRAERFPKQVPEDMARRPGDPQL